ncbi:hypothetical protein [Tenacibaculum finnmarkense]|uniref:hypothetical protein n=1 Tax=Tenacibaculum finnmarkense TaxID=2781243 RepID=UPI001E4BA7EF|nr:hypothetical protein [Tenacibaculum finnmarkense]MCD8401056.1 hypothetical protein [Tenacibaculum finnmarkense genomovar ulcerans]
MFGEIIDRIDKQFLDKINEDILPLIFQVLINVLFDGNYEKADEKLEELEKKSSNDEELISYFREEFPIFEFFEEIYFVVKNSSNISEFIHEVCIHEEKIIYIFNRVPKEQFLKLVNLYDENTETIKYFFTDFFGLNKFDEKEIRKVFFNTTKQEIADEFKINKRTFNKWLNVFFGNRFDNRKKIYIHEYIEIFNTFVDEGKEYLELTDFTKIKKRLEEGRSFDKTRIAFLTNKGTDKNSSTLLKIQKENVNFKYYKGLDKFPYSLTKRIVDRLGDELEF